MKTAEEWDWYHTNICANNPAVHGQLLPTPQMVEFIKQIQADALTKAAGIAFNQDYKERNLDDQQVCWFCVGRSDVGKAIESFRDSLNAGADGRGKE